MRSPSVETRHAFARKVIVPAMGFLIALFLVAIGGIYWVALYQTRVAIDEQTNLAKGAFRIFAQELGRITVDYATWDEAVTAIITKPNVKWLHGNIGSSVVNNLSVTMVFALDPNGSTIYSFVDSKDGTESPSAYLKDQFASMFTEWKTEPGQPALSRTLVSGGKVAAVSIAPLRSFLDQKTPPTGYSLVFVKVLDEARLKRFAEDFNLTNFGIAPNTKDVNLAYISFGDPKTNDIVHLAWEPRRPGNDLLSIVLPYMALVIVVALVIAATVLRYIVDSAQVLRDRERRAFTDPLTGLANRACLLNKLDQALSPSDRRAANLAVMYIDLDNFKPINDTMGHAAGDELLIQVARRLNACVRTTDMVARLGGDEFAIIVLNSRSRTELADVANRILTALATPFELDAGIAEIGCSIGIAADDGAVLSPAEILDRADQALYQVKHGSKNGFAFSHKDQDVVEKPDGDKSSHPVRLVKG